MMPPTMHIPVAEACLRHRRHLVTTSYVSPQMQALDAEARERGVLLMNEIGEDPGLDHMGAKAMIDQARREAGKVTALASYGAGLPWFDYYDDSAVTIEGSEILAGLKSVTQLGQDKGDVPLPENTSVTPENIIHLRQGLAPNQVREGRF